MSYVEKSLMFVLLFLALGALIGFIGVIAKESKRRPNGSGR